MGHPTFQSLQSECHGEFIQIPFKTSYIRTRCENKGKLARIDFDLHTANNWDLKDEAQENLKKIHWEYVEKNFNRTDYKNIASQFSKTSIRFDVLKEDVEEWFQWIWKALQNEENLIKLTFP